MPEREQGVELLQRSLERGRLAHAYLFAGQQLERLEAVARNLAKTLNCRQPARSSEHVAIDCCDNCPNCRKINEDNHADVHWVRPESKSRLITIEQMRSLMREMNLKPTEAAYKVAVVAGADRLNVQAANAFLKTLEEPPVHSVLILLTTNPQRILETILSRCLRLNFAGEELRPLTADEGRWLKEFSDMAASGQKSLIGRYRLLDVLLQKLNALKSAAEEELTARSPLRRYEDVDSELRKKWEDELAASIEAEYRLRRANLLALLQKWLRDVWLQSLATAQAAGQDQIPNRFAGLLSFPDHSGVSEVAGRIAPRQAMNNLELMETTQKLLHTNVQEALALEVGLLKLHL